MELHSTSLDDSGFIQHIDPLLKGILLDTKPSEVYLIKIDNWFDQKWLSFGGKVLGALGKWDHPENSTIPPFVPNRVLHQRYFKRSAQGDYSELESPKPLHRKQESAANLSRKITDVSKSGVFIWYSSNTQPNQHGSLMIYNVAHGTCRPFYLGFSANPQWKVVTSAGTNPREIKRLRTLGKPAVV